MEKVKWNWFEIMFWNVGCIVEDLFDVGIHAF